MDLGAIRDRIKTKKRKLDEAKKDEPSPHKKALQTLVERIYKRMLEDMDDKGYMVYECQFCVKIHDCRCSLLKDENLAELLVMLEAHDQRKELSIELRYLDLQILFSEDNVAEIHDVIRVRFKFIDVGSSRQKKKE